MGKTVPTAGYNGFDGVFYYTDSGGDNHTYGCNASAGYNGCTVMCTYPSGMQNYSPPDVTGFEVSQLCFSDAMGPTPTPQWVCGNMPSTQPPSPPPPSPPPPGTDTQIAKGTLAFSSISNSQFVNCPSGYHATACTSIVVPSGAASCNTHFPVNNGGASACTQDGCIASATSDTGYLMTVTCQKP
jgi:hypothetical protein